ncbi:hypothetical protein [Marinobacterium jannaschii]|uniref:hypothetical protein n=1 Tax=Marinobacterium jannaschii TaxID=64970 RepID=UPI000487EF7C|nr:hypothetical protein [Marinobacterium jannaschii]
MKRLLPALIIPAALLLTGTAGAASTEAEQLERWLKQFGNSLEQGGEISAPYIRSYLQCFDDQQALQSDQPLDLEKLLQQGLAAGKSCAPLLQQMVEALQQQRNNEAAEQNLRELLEKSL